MKILHVIPSVSERSGGPGHAIVEMCRALQQQGTEVLVATTDHGVTPVSSFEFRVSSLETADVRSEFGQPAPIQDFESLTRNSELETRNCYKGVPTIFFPMQWGQSFKYSRPLAIWLDQNVKAFDVVHIHAVFNHACTAAARACRKHGVPYVVRPLVTLHPWSMKQSPLRKRLFWYTVGKRMLRAAAAVHYTAPAEQQAVEQSLGLNHGTVIPLGIEADRFNQADAGKSFRQALPSLADHPYILVLSRLHPKKGLDVLVKAFLEVAAKTQFANWRLVLAGEGPSDFVYSLRRLANHRGAKELVLFPGWLEGQKKLSALSGASLLALPSYQENFGLCVMEAMACGVPVLVSPHVSLASEIHAAGAGWVAPVKKDAMKKVLESALGNAEERRCCARAGVEMAKAYRWPRAAAALNELYSSLALKRTSGSFHSSRS